MSVFATNTLQIENIASSRSIETWALTWFRVIVGFDFNQHHLLIQRERELAEYVRALPASQGFSRIWLRCQLWASNYNNGYNVNIQEHVKNCRYWGISIKSVETFHNWQSNHLITPDLFFQLQNMITNNTYLRRLLWKYFHEKLNVHLWYNLIVPVLGIYQKKRKESFHLYKDLYLKVHSSLICKSPKLETTQESINRWMNKQIVLLYTIEYYLAMKRNADTYINMDESQ